MNGTMHFSVLDGWWVEGFKPDAGWALTNERTYDNQDFQDDLDAEIIYSLFETEIIPAFYDRNDKDIPVEWVKFIKNTIAQVSPHFTTRRMIDDYGKRFYGKLFNRSSEMLSNDYQKIKEIANWKKHVQLAWPQMEVLEMKLLEKNTETIEAGNVYKAIVSLKLYDIVPENVGVELVITENFRELVSCNEFALSHNSDGVATFELEAGIDRPGTFQYGVRVFPKHELLPHKQDLGMLYWI